MRYLLPVKEVFVQLKKDSLRRFRQAVRDNKAALREHWEASQRARWAEQIADRGTHQMSELTFSDLGGDPTYMFAEELSDFGFRSISLDEEVAAAAHPESTTHSGDSQYTLVYNVDFAFPELPGEFPEIPLDTPRVVVFDLSGVILDREQTIRRALSDWLPLTHRFQTMDEILSVYIEIEALAARINQAVATSVAVIVDSALRTLASKLKIPLRSHPTLVTTSLVEIMNPRPCPDVEHAIASLSAHGRPVIVIPPHSEVSTRHFLSFIPRSQAKDVLLVITDVARKVAPASLADHPTPLVKRPGTTIASDVESS
ncbi:hypothetical protein C8Q73DRAFT_794547 [Cubamyces lactineus]|nr:hypothetical protein C8Q73DRAFT_794547 [Cubamyces lactineus]